MKILLVEYECSIPGGTEIVFDRETQLLQQYGHQIVIIHRDRPGNKIAYNGVVTYPLPDMEATFVRANGSSSSILDIVNLEKPDIVHFHSMTTFGDPATIFHIARIAPMVITVHNHSLICPSQGRFYGDGQICTHHFGVSHGLRCLLGGYLQGCNYRRPVPLVQRHVAVWRSRTLARHAARLIVVNEYMADTLVQNGFPRERISIVTPSVPGIPRKPVPYHSRLAGMILFVGRLSREKGVQYLLRASLNVDTKHQVVVVGDGSQRPHLTNLASSLGILEHVVFIGKVGQGKELDTLYDKASLMVVPSCWPEPFGLIGPEALVHGLPVVAFDVGGISSWLKNGENGFLVKVGDISGLANRITELLKDRRLAGQMGQRGRQLAETDYSEGRHLTELLDAYQKARTDWGDDR